MKKRYLLLIAVLFSSLLLIYGCGDDDGGGDQTVEELINQGWTKFNAGNYSGASGDFSAANGLTADTTEAYLGLGWSELLQSNAGTGENAFLTFLAKNPNSDDAKAGLAIANHALKEFEDAIDNAEAVLSSNPSWSFSRNSEINYLDLALVLASSYYAVAEFSQSLQVVQNYFEPGFSVDVTTSEGRKDLASKIESLYTG
jgi:tetratricopeptide (TPR) repeat protein